MRMIEHWTRESLGRLAALMVLAGCAAVLASCASVMPPKVTLNSVEIDGLSLDGVELLLNVDVSNPNGFGANVGRLEYKVDVDGTEMANGRMPQEVFVPAGGSAQIAIPFTVTWEGIGKGVEQYLDGSDHRWNLSGSARVSNGALSKTFRFSEDGQFQSPDAAEMEMDFQND